MAGKKRQRGELELKEQQTDRQTERHADNMPPTHPLQHVSIATAEWAVDGNLCMSVSVNLAYDPSSLPHLTTLKHRTHRWCCRMKTWTKCK